MTRPNDNAFPWEARDQAFMENGLTKREYMATHILTGLLANADNTNYELHASRAVKAADALIEELSKPK